MPSLWCVVSALTQTQAGGGDLLFRFASSVQSWGREGGALQAAVAVCGEHSVFWPGSQRLGALSTGAPPVRSQGVFRQEPGPVCRVGGGGFSGAEFAPFPSPGLLPPAGMGQLFSGVSQSLCFVNRRRCVPLVNFSLALPQFKKISLRLLSGPSGRSLP